MKAGDLLKRLEDAPFRPFRVHISDGTVLELNQPEMVIVGESTAVLPTLMVKDEDGYQVAKKWRTVALSHITQLSDIETSNGSRRKKK